MSLIRDSWRGVQEIERPKLKIDATAIGREAGREAARLLREAIADALPHRMTLKLPNATKTAITEQTVIGRRVPPLVVLEGVPESVVRIGAPLAQALHIPEVIFGMGDVPIQYLAVAFSRMQTPYVRFARHLPLTESWHYRGDDGKTTAAAAVADVVCHELIHCFNPNFSEEDVILKTNQFLLYGVLPGGAP